MAQYIEIKFEDITSEQTDILVAELHAVGFEGFEEQANLLMAFIPAKDFKEELVTTIAANHKLSFTKSTIEEVNWNANWESSFQPVIVDDFVTIRADFHPPVEGVELEIIITPKMSFGTGHHATTYMMIQQMREIDFSNKRVFDFGTGTGILSILAEKLGAASITAADNDEWSIENTAENLGRNDCHKVKLLNTDTIPAGEKFDIILANINKNVIVGNFSSIAGQLSTPGILLLSGLLVDDEKDIMKEAGKFPLALTVKLTRNNWISLMFKY